MTGQPATFIRVSDGNGRELFKGICKEEGVGALIINHLNKGVYYITMTSTNETFVEKVTKY